MCNLMIDKIQRYYPLRYWVPILIVAYTAALETLFIYRFHNGVVIGSRQTEWLLGTIVLMIAVFLIYYFLIFRRLQHLTKVVQRLGKGELDTRVSFAGGDEFSIVGDALNQMVEQLAADRHERQQVERKLREQTELFQELLVNIDTAVWSGDLESNSYLFVSSAVEQIYGYPAEQFFANPDFWFEAVHPDDRAYVLATNRAASTATECDREYRIIHADGNIRWIRERSYFLRDASGQARRLNGITSDITSEKQYQQVLAEQSMLATLRADLGLILGQRNALPIILQKCVSTLIEHLGTALVRIWIYNETTQMLELQAEAGSGLSFTQRYEQVPLGHNLIGWAAQRMHPYLTNDLPNDPNVTQHAWIKSEGIVAFAGYPLLMEERVIGIMAIFSRQLLSQATFDNLGGIADAVAQLIERKRAEEALALSEERLRLALDGAQDGVWDWDACTGKTTLNQQWLNMLGYVEDEIPSGKDSWTTLIHPDDIDHVTAALEAHIIGQSPIFEAEWRFRTKDGQWRWVLNRGQAVIRDEDGYPLRITGTCKDISERKQIELALQQSEARNRAILDALPDYVFICDKKGRYLYAHIGQPLESVTTKEDFPTQQTAIPSSPAWLRSTQLPNNGQLHADDFLGKRVDQILPSPYGQQVLKAIEVALQGKRQVLEHAFLLPNDDVRQVEAHIVPLDEDKVVIIVRDITERKLMEEERSVRKIAETVPHMMFVYDLEEERHIYVNRQVSRDLGYTPEEFLELGADFLPQVLHEDMLSHFTALRERWETATNDQVFESEYQMRHVNGEWRWFLGRDTVFTRTHDGDVRQIIGTAQDITENKRAQDQLLAALNEKDALLKEVHHRVKNNLQIISSLLNLQASQISEPNVLDIFNETKNRVRSMALLHETLYRTENLAQIDFHHYVLALCNSLLRSLGVDINRIHLTIQIQNVTLDMERAIPCGLIINELVTNAVKHAFPNNRSGQITIAMQKNDCHSYQLTVCDDGCGLLPEQQTGQATTLGLRLVHDLTTQLRGKLTISSDAGTEFQIMF